MLCLLKYGASEQATSAEEEAEKAQKAEEGATREAQAKQKAKERPRELLMAKPSRSTHTSYVL
jgi:hypothetical protein